MLQAITRTRVTIRPVPALDETTKAQMWSLYAPHHYTDRTEFEERLSTLDEIALFTRRHDRALIGFCGLRYRTVELEDVGRVATFYVGLSYVEREWRSTALTQRMVVRRVLGPLLSPRFRRVYFWADCLTYRPYLAMARNLIEYYPSRTQVTPDEVREVITTLGRTYYGDSFDEKRGTVRKDARRIKEHEAVISAADLRDPDIGFYRERNRDYDRGDGLIAICPMGVRNLVHLVGRQMRKRVRTVHARPRHVPESALAPT